MAEKDKVIKSGQFTFSRILLLAVVGGVIVVTVALGGVWLSIGYWLLTIGICALLLLIAIDYGVKMDRADMETQPAQVAVSVEQVAAAAQPSSEPRPRRRSRPAKRRR